MPRSRRTGESRSHKCQADPGPPTCWNWWAGIPERAHTVLGPGGIFQHHPCQPPGCMDYPGWPFPIKESSIMRARGSEGSTIRPQYSKSFKFEEGISMNMRTVTFRKPMKLFWQPSPLSEFKMWILCKASEPHPIFPRYQCRRQDGRAGWTLPQVPVCIPDTLPFLFTLTESTGHIRTG